MVYAAIKDILIVAQARNDWSVLSQVANKISPEQLAGLPAGMIGAVRMQPNRLLERGFRERGRDEAQCDAHPINRTLENYISTARAQIAAGDYFTNSAAESCEPADKAA